MKTRLIESLETRRLFAVTLTNGLLAIDGTDQADTITITVHGDVVSVRDNADRQTFNLADVDQVAINALGGNDRISLGKLDLPAAIDGGTGDDRITGGRGDDVITGGDGNDVIHGGGGDDQLFGATGSDKLFGDAGDDELTGGEGADTLSGGTGFDSTDFSGDNVTSIEDLGNGNVFNNNQVAFGASNDGFGNFFNDPGFAALRNNFAPVNTNGLMPPAPGSDVISPLLSSAPGGNQTFFNPVTGVTLQNGGAFINLPNTSAFVRSFGATTGNNVQGWFTGD